MRQHVTLQGIFQAHFPAYAKAHKLPLRALKAASAIMHCRTPLLGGHVQHCPQAHMARIQYHSCRHRACAQCSRLPRAQWAERQAARLLDCDHYHVVFTLPHELLSLWSYNRATMARLLFGAARDALLTLLADRRFLGATPGLLLALHTWGRTLNHHPHVHCLVSGGGIDAAGAWQAVTNGYLLPVRVVKTVFRGKLLAAIEDGLRNETLRQPPDTNALRWARTRSMLYKKNWNVCLKERYADGEGVLRYLARYMRGGPISDQRLGPSQEGTITFGYRDHHDGKHKTMHLSCDQFLARLLWHVPQPRQHTIRYAGLYATQSRRQHTEARVQLNQPESRRPAASWQDTLERLGRRAQLHCRDCGRRLVRGATLAPVRLRDENSYSTAVPSGFAQLFVEADPPNAPPPTNTGPPVASDIFLRGGGLLN
jgi:Putative transposase/Transposase zinc-binding domain